MALLTQRMNVDTTPPTWELQDTGDAIVFTNVNIRCASKIA
jgi:hypothetical protein